MQPESTGTSQSSWSATKPDESLPHMKASSFLRTQLKLMLDAHYDRRSKTIGGVINSPELQDAELKAFEEFSFALENYVVMRVTDTTLKVHGVRSI